MSALSTRTTLLLNWYANPYHTPIFVAHSLGYYQQEGIKLAILEPSDPSDVTEIVGMGHVDFGVKAMIHTLAARAKGYPVTSIGTLLDEPPTGLIALKSSGISSFQDIVGKRVGYIGEFGKIIIDNLAKLAGIAPTSYETVRIGMNVTDAICRDLIDTGIGFINFQKVELEHLRGETVFLRLDQLAGLGCCCFCSIQFIVPERMLKNPETIKGFLKATQRGAAFTTENPDEAYELLCRMKPQLRTPMYHTIFIRSLPFFSRTLLNVERDWNKVGRFGKHLGVIDESFAVDVCYTNEFLPKMPHSDLEPIACCVGE
ncbi:ABC transporter substrate-binding protein [Legionella parisiensis]|uniref:Thiamine pyrimidine synthase n=1 Tax=Legionella parisiensis TaxID=45071 RepID=A0A1E5JPQ1_9GAMM|nr:ABC transporter substrate-binding protein [Legionella parisiensis]KTD41979.1 thiamine biosynthesis protein NMT-1 [Legionella parisiensis]OEH46343.1 putative thiamine biosynthesis protein [Legionella parisiensis]STX75590.1 thiamine biosynthesis protein NMT-1 [Legionella parisiensis]